MRMRWAFRPTTRAVLTAEVETARWFEALLAAKRRRQGKGARCRQAGGQLADVRTVRRAQPAGQGRLRIRPVTPSQAAELLALVALMARFRVRLPSRSSKRCWKPARRGAIVEREGPQAGKRQRRDRRHRSTRCSPTMPTRSSSIKGGKEALFGFFVGQTMKAMQGKANPQRGQRAAEKGSRCLRSRGNSNGRWARV
jgi:aspartyl-tRNA(Asn)/glutamyl-tRNA(Gln) amidotransferase subunit B